MITSLAKRCTALLYVSGVRLVGRRAVQHQAVLSQAKSSVDIQDPVEIKGSPVDVLTDTHRRQHTYLRISLTERCNLRCLYCMPEEGVTLSPNRQILTSPEIVHLSRLFVSQGVTKIRLTGGEPSVRKDFFPLLRQLGELKRDGLQELAITTNALTLSRKVETLADAGVTGLNISLDTLDPWQFQLLTRRSGFDAVMRTIDRVLELNRRHAATIKLKINTVVMRGLNEHQIVPFVEFTRQNDVEVRFIEYMPFGGNKWSRGKMVSYAEMLDMIRTAYPSLTRAPDATAHETAKTWHVPGFAGRVGFITSMSEHFCASCNRLRITADGNFKVCLHGRSEVSLRDIIRGISNGEPIAHALSPHDAMQVDQQLLQVIGAAVKRKKASHDGWESLQHGDNRPMILIGG